MFDDEMRVALKKMHEFSPVDGFVEITESVGDTIRYVANEPSVGLFFVQQHTKNAAPNLYKLKNKISNKSNDTTFHTEDLDDSTAIVKSMKECGNPIINEMVKHINKSLSVISTKKPKIGLIRTRNNDSDIMGNCMSSMISSAREKATNFKLPHFDTEKWRQSKGERSRFVSHTIASHFEPDKLPISSPCDDLEREESSSSSNKKWIPLFEKSYGDFRVDREAELEEWLGEKADENDRKRGNGD